MKISKSNIAWISLIVINIIVLIIIWPKSWRILKSQNPRGFAQKDEKLDLDHINSLLQKMNRIERNEVLWSYFLFMDLRPLAIDEFLLEFGNIIEDIQNAKLKVYIVSKDEPESISFYRKANNIKQMHFVYDENHDLYHYFGVSECCPATVLLDQSGKVEYAKANLLSPRDSYLLLSSR